MGAEEDKNLCFFQNMILDNRILKWIGIAESPSMVLILFGCSIVLILFGMLWNGRTKSRINASKCRRGNMNRILNCLCSFQSYWIFRSGKLYLLWLHLCPYLYYFRTFCLFSDCPLENNVTNSNEDVIPIIDVWPG